MKAALVGGFRSGETALGVQDQFTAVLPSELMGVADSCRWPETLLPRLSYQIPSGLS